MKDSVAPVTVRGAGVAASCCARLLEQAGIPVVLESGERPAVPAIMLGETAQKLLRDALGSSDLCDGGTPVRRRIVAWGSNREPIEFPHSATVVSERKLLERIGSGLRPLSARLTPGDQGGGWTIHATRPLPKGTALYQFGSRKARASRVGLRSEAPDDACWIESLDAGWLFLLPSPRDGQEPASTSSGWLLAVGGHVLELLAQSEFIARQIMEPGPESDEFPCHPRIVHPLCEPGWLICGTAAVGFDPLCGDGAGYAVREAILASAVIRAAMGGGDPEALAEHYRAGILAGFRKHLFACREFYTQGRKGAWWSWQLEDLERGLAWCTDQLAQIKSVRFRLNGFELQPLTKSAF